MTSPADWPIIEPDVDAALRHCPRPLDELAAGHIPAIVIRNAWPRHECQQLIERLIERELLYDRTKPIPEQFVKRSIPEGYYREGTSAAATRAWESQPQVGKNRIDIGTSLGYRGSDQQAFLEHAEQTRTLFEDLFAGHSNPIELMYDTLSRLAVDQQAVTAREPDGRQYGPAIIRAHYGGYTYAPHFDSVRLREKRTNYAVHDFEHQFAGVLVLQNSTRGDRTAQCRIHRCLWTEDVDPALRRNQFHDYAQRHAIPSVEVCLEAGDLYFFNTRCIHEVPGVPGELPRIVLATFIGYSPDRSELFVWS